MTRTATDWAIGVLIAFAVLFLMAYLDSKQSETGALQLSAEISNDRAAEYAAINKQAANVAMKEQ